MENTAPQYPYRVRVPVEMRAFQEGSTLIIFLLHVMDGYINELEIVSAALTWICEDKIDFTEVVYEIASEVKRD